MLTETILIINKRGLHARAAAKLATLAAQFGCRSQVRASGSWVDAKSVMSLMLLVSILVFSSFTGCSKKTNNYLNVSLTADPGTADVQKTTDAYGLPLNIFDRLIEVETTGPGESTLVPGLADSWDVSKDGLIYTFHLKKDVKFHNGEILKADDVLYTFDRMLDPKTKALNTDFLNMIAGAQDRSA